MLSSLGQPGGEGLRLNVKTLTSGLKYHDEVDGKRQHYYIFSGGAYYFVMSLSATKPGAGNFNLVSKTSVARLLKRLRGQRSLTAKGVRRRSRSRRMVLSDLTALNMLYVLVATGQATIDRRHKSRQIFFNVRP
jgi:hypothetical protein